MDDTDFETHDIYLAAYLKIAGCQMKGRRRQGPRWYFIFINPGGSMKDMREAYFTDRGLVPAKKYADEVRSMKELCFD